MQKLVRFYRHLLTIWLQVPTAETPGRKHLYHGTNHCWRELAARTNLGDVGEVERAHVLCTFRQILLRQADKWTRISRHITSAGAEQPDMDLRPP